MAGHVPAIFVCALVARPEPQCRDHDAEHLRVLHAAADHFGARTHGGEHDLVGCVYAAQGRERQISGASRRTLDAVFLIRDIDLAVVGVDHCRPVLSMYGRPVSQ